MKTHHNHTLRAQLAGLAFVTAMVAWLGGAFVVEADGLAHRHGGAASAKGQKERAGPASPEGHHVGHEGTLISVEITMRDGAYHVSMDGHAHKAGFSLVAGSETVLTIRNEDTSPHELISPLFTRMDVAFAGSGVGIFKREAAGFRLYPGKTLTLRFTAPYSDFKTMYDLFWCGMHGENREAPNPNEFLVVATRELSEA